MSRVFTSGPGDQGSIPSQVIPKTQKMILDATLLSTQYYKVRIKVKWSNPGNGVAPSPTPWCSSYWKGSRQITLDYVHQLYFFFFLLLIKRSEVPTSEFKKVGKESLVKKVGKESLVKKVGKESLVKKVGRLFSNFLDKRFFSKKLEKGLLSKNHWYFYSLYFM